MKKMKVAICVGHSRSGDSGALSVDNVTEQEFNNLLANQLYAALQDVNVEAVIINDYEGATYSEAMSDCAFQVRAEDCDFAIELHFNAAGPKATGYEYLYWHASTNGQALAECFNQAHKAEFPQRTDRGIKPRDREDRGGQFLQKTHCPAVICEPFFGTNPFEWHLYRACADRLVYAYASAIELFANWYEPEEFIADVGEEEADVEAYLNPVLEPTEAERLADTQED